MFKEELRTGTNIVHCRTKEQAEAFVDWCGCRNPYWPDLVKSWWRLHKEETCYKVYEGEIRGYSSVKFYRSQLKIIISYEEALKPCTFKTGDKVIARFGVNPFYSTRLLYYHHEQTDSRGNPQHVLRTKDSSVSYFFTLNDFKLYEEEEKTEMTETEKELEKLQKQMDVLKETIKNENITPKLHISTDNNYSDLDILFGEEVVGKINYAGECYILDTPDRRATWERWVKAGMPVDSTSVTWRGASYFLTIDSELVGESSIYDFEYALPCMDCSDNNINRYSNGTPILY